MQIPSYMHQNYIRFYSKSNSYIDGGNCGMKIKPALNILSADFNPIFLFTWKEREINLFICETNGFIFIPYLFLSNLTNMPCFLIIFTFILFFTYYLIFHYSPFSSEKKSWIALWTLGFFLNNKPFESFLKKFENYSKI